MQAEMPGAEAAPIPTPEPAGEAAFQSTVLTLLEQMQAGLAHLSARVDAVEDGRPRFAKPLPDELLEVEDAASVHHKVLDDVTPDGQLHQSKIPVFSDGLAVHDLVMAQYQPRFRDGQRIRLNLDVAIPDREDGQTRRNLKLQDKTPDGVGEILNVQFLSKQPGRGWKYRCKFPSKVLPGSNGGVSSFYESELIPA